MAASVARRGDGAGCGCDSWSEVVLVVEVVLLGEGPMSSPSGESTSRSEGSLDSREESVAEGVKVGMTIGHFG